MDHKRKLSAILSADVAGYSRLMAGDEVATIRSLNDARALDRERIENHSGRKHSGDFGSASFRFV